MLHNLQAVPIDVEVALVESGRSPAAAPLPLSTVQLMPGETRALSDVAGALGRDVAGALIVGANLPFAVTSRTRSEGRLGQTVAPMAITGAADAVNATAVLPSLTTNARQRSNVGAFIAATRAPLVVEVVALSAAGAPLGSHRIVAEEPGFLHRQLAIAPAADGASVTVAIRVLQGDGVVVPYASIIDNATAEALFVPGEPIAVGGAATVAMVARSVGARQVQ